MILLLAWGVGMGASDAGTTPSSGVAGTLPLVGVGR